MPTPADARRELARRELARRAMSRGGGDAMSPQEMAQPPSATRRFLSGAAEHLNPRHVVSGIRSIVTDPVGTGRGLIRAQVEQFEKGRDAPSVSERLGHFAAGMLPLIGPAAAAAGERIGQGDIAGGLGEGVGLLATAGGGGAAGRVAGRGMQAGARRVYQGALRPSKSTLEHFPDTVQAGLNERIAVSPRGGRRANRLKRQSAADVDALITERSPRVAPIQPGEIISGTSRSYGDIAQRPLRGDALQNLDDLNMRVLQENPAPLPLTQAQRMKRASQDISDKAFRAEAQGHPINATEAMFNRDVAGSLQGAIERRVPEVRGMNRRTQNLMGVEDALDDRLRNIGNQAPTWMPSIRDMVAGGAGTVVGGVPGGVVGMGLSRVMRSPAMQSRAAILANELARPRGAARLGVRGRRTAPGWTPPERLIQMLIAAELEGQQGR